MSDDNRLDRRDFLATASLAGAAVGAGSLLMACEDRKEKSEAAGGSGGTRTRTRTQESDMKKSDPADKLRTEQLVARLSQIKTFTRLDFDKIDGEPFEDTLRAALAGEPERLTWLFAPTGDGLGVAAHGKGEDFGAAVSDYVERMIGKDRAAVFDRLRRDAPAAAMDMEFVLARPSWFRAGIRLESFEQLRTILEGLGAPEDVLGPMLAYEDIEGARPVWLQMAKPGDTNGRLMAGTRLPADALPLEEDDSAPKANRVPKYLARQPVTVDVLADSDRRWLRRPGLEGRELIEWQQARGVDKKSPIKRVGDIQGALEADGPDWMAWERGKSKETLVYGYAERP